MRFYSTLLSLISAVITLFFFLSTVSQAEDQGGCLKPGWPSERSDLQPDPALTRGTLDNGLRYVVLENQEPRDRVALFSTCMAVRCMKLLPSAEWPTTSSICCLTVPSIFPQVNW